MPLALPPPVTDNLTPLQALALPLDDPRPHPDDEALRHLGHAVITEVLDVIGDTALEDFQALVCETVIGGFHSAVQRIDREADRARDALSALLRDFDGSEVLDTDIQDATRKARAADVAVMALEMVRDTAAASYLSATGEVWQPWAGHVRASRTTAAQIDAREALRARKAERHAAAAPGAVIVAFRGAPNADTALDAGRIFDALNWARDTWPDMALTTSGAKGAERLAMKWAQQKAVTLVLARADFDRDRRAAPFRANEAMLALEPVCVLTLVNSLDAERGQARADFGPALNLAQRAQEAGVLSHRIAARRDPG
jgi:YspA, cpYpsA-related SLOG family